MMARLAGKLALLCALVTILVAGPLVAQPGPSVKIAFIGDQGLGPNARAVLRLTSWTASACSAPSSIQETPEKSDKARID